jgi:nicotinamidase-related amidase
MPANPLRICRARAALLVIDLQERLLPVISGHELVTLNSSRLIQAARILQIPVYATEQYRKGLGPTVPEITSALAGVAPVEKLTFSACADSELMMALAARASSDIILCGIETHVCVCQTCLDLRSAGLRPFVVADATSSRTPENHRLGLDRMRDAGATIVSTEMVLFELVERAGTDEFKQVLALVK